jgi:NAD-dependent DNA ligase
MKKLTSKKISLNQKRYEMDESVISDEEYDWICKELDKKWDEVEHQHKHFVDRDALSAGTGFQLRKYPARVEFAAKQLLDDCKDI